MNDARTEHLRSRWGVWPAAAVLGAALMGSGCGADKPGDAKSPAVGRAEGLTHEECGGGARVDALDTNGDGKPDIRRSFDGSGHELCRVADVNHDGKPDLYEYFDAAGNVRRREYCYDDLGVVNAVEYYEGGKLVRREYDVSGRHRIDTWDWFDPNAPVDATTGRPAHPSRRERDTTGDGHVDQWWTWNGDQLSIANDRNGDGKPDPDTVLVIGGDGGAPQAASSASPGAGGPDGGSAVTSDGGSR
jgi:hypothetical protein